MNILKLVLIYLVVGLSISHAQDLLEDLSTTRQIGDEAEVFSEKIINIGRSQKVFILTNANGMLNKGDFITFILEGKEAVARALVAKNHDSLVGVKILKIYSLKNWSKIYKNMDIKILKGDDSILFVSQDDKDKSKDGETTDKIEGEEDLYAEELALEESFEGDFSKDQRLIKPDNIVNAAFGKFTFNDSKTDNNDKGAFEWTGGWAYQFKDNYWFEGLGTLVSITDYPDGGDSTIITRFTFRLKYTIKLPFYSYLLPYAGYQINTVSSPNATDDVEKANIDKLAEGKFAVGATLLRRLVPGWFLKVDLGTDLINIGAAIEF